MRGIILENLILPLNDIKDKTSVWQCLQFLRRSQFWSEERKRKFQEKKINALIRYADKTVPYYHRLFKQNKIDVTQIKSAEDLKRIPPLSKEIVRYNHKDLISIGRKRNQTLKGRTGGSTGLPLQFTRDKLSKSWALGCMHRFWEWTGMKPGERKLGIGGGSLGGFLGEKKVINKIKSFWMNSFEFSAFNLTTPNLEILCKWIKDSKIRFIRGYPSTLQILSKYILENGYETPNVSVCYTTAERLFEFQRELIEKAFSAKVFDQYGCGEINALAGQCENASLYHIFEEHVVIEVPETQNYSCYPARITDLDSFAMPFIRYENGDILEFESSSCSCGRSLSTLKKIIGRTHDFLLTTNEVMVPGEFIPHLFQVVVGFNEYFVHQKEQDYIEVQIVPNSKFSESETKDLTKIMREYLGKNMKIRFIEVEEILKPSSEKTIFVKSDISPRYFNHIY